MAINYSAGTITVDTNTYTLDQINTAIANDAYWQKLGELHHCKVNLLITSSGAIIDSDSGLQIGTSASRKNFQTNAGTSFEMTGCFLMFWCSSQITSYGTWKFENCSIFKNGGGIGLYMRGTQDHKRSEFKTDFWYNRDGQVSYYKCLMQNTSNFYYYTSGTIDDFRVTGAVMTYYANPTFKNTTMLGNYSFGSNNLHATFINSTWGSLSFPGANNYLLDKWEFNILVKDDNNNIITDADVELKDKNGDVKHTGTTGADGKLPSAWEVLANRYDGTAETKTEYNPFTLKVTKGTDETEYKIVIDHIISKDIVLIPQSVASYDNIMAGITDIKGTGFVKDTDSLVDIRPETGKIQSVKTETDKLTFSGNNIQARVADKGTLNNPPSESIEDYKDKNTEQEIKDAIDNYANKNTYKATGFSTHSIADIWNYVPRTLSSFGTLINDIWNELHTEGFHIDSFGQVIHSLFRKFPNNYFFSSTLPDNQDGKLDFLKDIEGGKWHITDEDGGTMIFYKADNVTEVARFALYDGSNNRTSDPTKAVRRERI